MGEEGAKYAEGPGQRDAVVAKRSTLPLSSMSHTSKCPLLLTRVIFPRPRTCLDRFFE